MNTVVLKVDPRRPEPEKIRAAAEVLRRGGLVAFPTETVYGLGANALDEKAVLRIFEAKNRPADNPIIVHVAEKEDIYVLAEQVPELAERLIDRFWPGPLTLLFPKSEVVPKAVTAGLDIVAIRMPSHAVARALIAEAGVPIAAPSANLAGRPSPTSAEHVLRDLGGRIEMVIDGGEISYGLESTVLDLTIEPPTVLRPGPVTVEELRELIGEVEIHPAAKAEAPVEEIIARSPGMKYRHYAPLAEMVVVEGPIEKVRSKIQELVDVRRGLGEKVGVMATEETAPQYRADVVKVAGSRRDPRSVAKNLFRLLREFDAEGVDLVVAEGLEPVGMGLAVMNRLRKAAGYNIIRVESDR
ncbi:MAG: L-threonylcarbamoyladenylate synthase [Hadesarchaea archaeon]|nr:L-threonylcarbamoyladenylate synthase [Hadesarchaea archaeon]